MRKKLILPLCLLLVFCLCGCSAVDDLLGEVDGLLNSTAPSSASLPSSGDNDDGDNDDRTGYEYEDTAVNLTEDTTYHNGYLGISYTLPKGWWQYEVNSDNMSQSADMTDDISLLDVVSGSGYKYISLLSYANLQYSNKDNHIGIDLNAEQVEGIESLADYGEYYIDYMLEPYEGATYTLISQENITLGGTEFLLCDFEVAYTEYSYNIMTLSCAVGNGYFLNILGNYWPENDIAKDTFTGAVEAALSIG